GKHKYGDYVVEKVVERDDPRFRGAECGRRERRCARTNSDEKQQLATDKTGLKYRQARGEPPIERPEPGDLIRSSAKGDVEDIVEEPEESKRHAKEGEGPGGRGSLEP